MKTVHDHAGYATAAKILDELTTGRDALEAELNELVTTSAKNVPQTNGLSATATALAFVRGEALPMVAPPNATAQRQTDVMHALSEVHRALNYAASEVNHQTNEARAEAIAERKAEVATISKKWQIARDALSAALAAENDFVDTLIEQGFGRHHPAVTSPRWLNRNDAMRDLGTSPRYP